jgi:hypothetical protein
MLEIRKKCLAVSVEDSEQGGRVRPLGLLYLPGKLLLFSAQNSTEIWNESCQRLVFDESAETDIISNYERKRRNIVNKIK